MKYLLLSALQLILIASLTNCSKDQGDDNTQPDPIFLPDTLSTGWVKDSVPTIAPLYDVFFINQNTGYTVTPGGVRKSIDGGTSWSAALTPGPYGFLNIAATPGGKVVLVSVVQNGGLASSQNFGDSYTTMAFTPLPARDPLFCTDAFFTSESICYASGRAFLYKSVDGGVSFNKIFQFAPSVDGGYSSVFFLNDNEGWVSATGGLYKTVNGGVNWELKLDVNQVVIDFVNTSVGYISSLGAVRKTTDGGNTWQVLPFPEPITIDNTADVDFVSENEGYILTRKSIYKTIDGGQTWSRVVKIGSKELYELHFIDANHGWASGSYGMMLKFTQ